MNRGAERSRLYVSAWQVIVGRGRWIGRLGALGEMEECLGRAVEGKGRVVEKLADFILESDPDRCRTETDGMLYGGVYNCQRVFLKGT